MEGVLKKMTGISRENGYLFLNVMTDGEYIEAYNFTRGICGYGDDMRDWGNAGDLWGDIAEGSPLIDGGYAVSLGEEQFTKKEIKEIMGDDEK